jgi:hypothetical protein
MAGRVARMGEKKNACRILLGKPEGLRPLGIATRRWWDIIKMEFKGMRCEFVKLIWPRIEKSAGCCEQSSESSVVFNTGSVLTVRRTVGLSRTTVLRGVYLFVRSFVCLSLSYSCMTQLHMC